MKASPQREPEINKLFRLAWKHAASDLYLQAGSPPLLQITGVTRKVEIPPLSGEAIERLLDPILSAEHKQLLSEAGVVEFEHVVEREKWVFHLNVLKKDGQVSLSARLSAEP
jgi:Tfp pilus assembly pilus retraction ATPase PilT